MDNRITIEQATDIVRKQWEEDGNTDLYSVASRLSPLTDESLVELVVVHAQAAAVVGVTVDIFATIKYFPQLAPHQKAIEARLTSMLDTDLPSVPAVDMFSAGSIEATLDHKSQTASESGRSQTSVVQSIAKRSVPFTIGNFLVEKFIGEGSFGTVWAGRDKRLGRKVAIKIKHGSDGDGLSEDFLHEAKSIARLEHSQIVRLLQADETEEGIGYLIYEYVEGETLDHRIKEGNYTISECVQWIASIADALDYAHRCAIIHRDISPRNIMITSTGNARLLDFGLSSIDGNFYIEDKDRILGTPVFMSPEQASGNPHWATSYSDQFSLGSVLYYSLTKKLAFAGSNTFDVLERVQKAAPASLRSIRADIPLRLEEACLRALAKEPQKRYSTAADMAAALVNSLIEPVAATSSPTRTMPSAYALLAFGALLVVLGAAASFVGLKELLAPATSSESELVNIEDFDLKATLPTIGQVSLFEKQSKMVATFTKPFRLTVVGDGLKRSRDKIYIFNYRQQDGRLVGNWHSFDVDGQTTTVKAEEFRPGPNIVVVVAAKKALPEAVEKPKFLPEQPIEFDKTVNDTSKLIRANRSVYVYYNNMDFKNKDFGEYAIVRAPGDRIFASDSQFLNELAEKWDNDAVDFKKQELGSFTYCGTAFWINHEGIAEAK